MCIPIINVVWQCHNTTETLRQAVFSVDMENRC